MVTLSRSRTDAEPGSGGKIVRSRRLAAGRTPYDRPRAPPRAPASPGLFAGFILPASRKIANGAGKLISTVLGSESSEESSSDSDSGSGEDDAECANGENYLSSQGAGWLNKNDGAPSEMIMCLSDERQPVVRRTETKRVIEQLLMQETFSREECDRLIEIIKLRVAHSPTIQGDADVPNTSGTAVREARKWLEENKSGSSAQLGLDQGNAVTLPRVTEGDAVSPVDMAKSFMRSRPPWASPSVDITFSNSSPVVMNSLMEETPSTVGCNSLHKSKLKKDPLASGSWSIQEELRKVRSRATEEMLKNLPSTRTDFSAFSSEHKTGEHVLSCSKVKPDFGVEPCSLNLLTTNGSTDASLNLFNTVDQCQDIPDLEAAQDGLQNDAVPPSHLTSVLDRNQDLEARGIIEGRECAATESPQSGVPNLASKSLDDRKSDEPECLTLKEMTAPKGSTETAHGISSPGTSSYAEAVVDTNPDPSKEEKPVGSSHDKINTDFTEETCDVLSEASMEIPTMNENDNAANGSHATSKRSLLGKAGSKLEKQQGQKRGRYTRKRGGK